jgi:hypothetical protein
MPIIGYKAQGSAVSEIYYNDLYLNTTRTLLIPDDIKTRKECYQDTPIQQPYTYCQPDTVAYGLAMTGIVDQKKETLPVSLDVGHWSEVSLHMLQRDNLLILCDELQPDWGAEDNLDEKPIPFTGSLTVSN